jgi:hypothetical protein
MYSAVCVSINVSDCIPRLSNLPIMCHGWCICTVYIMFDHLYGLRFVDCTHQMDASCLCSRLQLMGQYWLVLQVAPGSELGQQPAEAPVDVASANIVSWVSSSKAWSACPVHVYLCSDQSNPFSASVTQSQQLRFSEVSKAAIHMIRATIRSFSPTLCVTCRPLSAGA